MLDSNLTNIELTKIIRSLVNFIVVDTKNHLDDNLREEYIKKYIYLLVKTSNGKSDLVDISKVKEIISNDIQQIST